MPFGPTLSTNEVKILSYFFHLFHEVISRVTPKGFPFGRCLLLVYHAGPFKREAFTNRYCNVIAILLFIIIAGM